jgi:hypothetical protein
MPLPAIIEPGRAGRGRFSAISPTFPLQAHSSGRYLVTPTGAPFRLRGDSGWLVFNELTLAQVRQYFDDRVAHGFNAVVCQATNPVRYVSANVSPAAAGASSGLPFLNSSGSSWNQDTAFRDNIVNGVAQGSATGNFDADFSRPVDAYWDWVDTVINEAGQRSIAMIIDPCYMGFGGGENDGWWRTLSNTQNTQSVCLGFGTYLGNRWRNHANLILSMGTDMFPTSASEASARFAKIFDGLVAAGCTVLTGAHYQRSSDSLDYSDYASRITVNMVYPGAGGGGSHTATYGRCRTAYARSPAKPVFCVEATYEGEGSRTREQVRSYGWWAQLSSTAGYVFGNNPIWDFDTGWQTALSANGSLDMQRMGAFLDALPWHQLVPDGLGSIGTLVTAGGGTAQTLGSVGSPDNTNGLDFVTAAATPDGSTLIAYVPHAHSGTVTIDMTKLRGAAVCDWYDPTNGSSTAIGSIANTGTHAFTTPGTNADGASDWVLRILA